MEWNGRLGTIGFARFARDADTSLFEFLRRDRSRLNRYTVAISIVLISLILSGFFWVPERGFLVAINVIAACMAALYGGLGPGALAGAISAWGVGFRILEPISQLTTGDYLFAVVYYVTILMVGSLVCHLRSAYKREYDAKTSAENALRDRDDIMAIVSHDLRAPLMAISLNCRNLFATPIMSTDEASHRRLVAIQSSVRRMNDLIQGILTLSKMGEGVFTVETAHHDVTEVIKEICESFLAQASERNIQLRASVESALPKVVIDRSRIGQVLANLVDNALKFTPAGKAVTIGAALVSTTNCVEISVSDEGAGIPSDCLPHIFDRYWKANQANKGVGLGLYISMQIVKAHQSQIHVESEVGQGTCFKFALRVY